jgi:hypothetical protein
MPVKQGYLLLPTEKFISTISVPVPAGVVNQNNNSPGVLPEVLFISYWYPLQAPGQKNPVSLHSVVSAPEKFEANTSIGLPQQLEISTDCLLIFEQLFKHVYAHAKHG